MLRRILHWQINAFEQNFQYDASYCRDFVRAGLGAFAGLWGVTRLAGYRKDIPAAPWFAAKIAASMAAGCGPCTQLEVRMGERAGVSPSILRAIVAGDVEPLEPEVQLGYRFAVATLTNSDELAQLRQEAVRHWGQRALVSLAGAIAAAAVFPTLKTPLGYDHSCALAVEVGGKSVPVARPISA